MSHRSYVFLLLAATLASPAFAWADALELKPGDHICIIGNTLADRMQHDGWLETVPPQPLSRARPRHPQPRLLRRRADAPAPLGRLRHARPVADAERRPTSSSPSSATTSRSPARRA